MIIRSHIPDAFSKTLNRIYEGFKLSFNNLTQRMKLVRKNGDDIAAVLTE